MKRRHVLNILSMMFIAALSFSPATVRASAPQAPSSSVQAPVLKWAYGGCYSSGCETGWYSSPAVADLDKDGKMEIIGSAYTIFVLDSAGHQLWKMPSGFDRSSPNASSVGRTWPGIVVADIDKDGWPEIITAHSGGYVSVYDHNGYFKPGWPQRPVSDELRSLAVADLDGDGFMEIAVGRAQLNSQNIWVYNHDGTVRAGWPQLSGTGSAAGIYNNNIALGDLVPGGNLEVVVPDDVITIAAYDANGGKLPVNSKYYSTKGNNMRSWSEVPAYIDPAYELQGYGPCYTQFTPRANFADSPADIADVNGDGVNEVVVVGNTHNCNTSPYTDLYDAPFIFNADRSRFKSGAFDWSIPPVNNSAPLSEDYNLIETAEPNPVTVDLDGDGKLEILYASYDGKVHAYWLDKTEHGSWPFSVYHPSDKYLTFASEPVVADLNGDGKPEVIFTTWTSKGSRAYGKLYILDNLGNPLQAVSLPAPKSSSEDWNGAMAAPTLADIDGDGNLEVVLNTANSGLVAYTLPGTAGANVIWGTGRGNTLRNGWVPQSSLNSSGVSVTPPSPKPGALLIYTITLSNPGSALAGVTVTDALPAEVTYLGNATASSGVVQPSGNGITWSGTVPTNKPVTITFQGQLASSISGALVVQNSVLISDGRGNNLTRTVSVIVNGINFFAPLIIH